MKKVFFSLGSLWSRNLFSLGGGVCVGASLATRVFNGISFREIFAKRKRNEFRNFAKKKIIFAKFRVSRKCHFSENKQNETKRNETKQTKRNAVELCETKKTFEVREGKKQLY
jgi:hypothetical protein